MRWIVAIAVIAVLGAAWALRGRADPAPVQRAAVDAPPEQATPRRARVREDASGRPSRAPLRSPCRSFRELLDALVAHGKRMAAEAEAGRRERVVAMNPRALALLGEIRRCVRDPEEAALFELTAPRPSGSGSGHDIRRRVCLFLVRQGLERRHRGEPRPRLEAFVATLLDVLAQSEDLAHELGLGLLADRPYLGLVHEARVLDLVEESGRQEFLVPVATALLRTLWRNLERSGARTSGELASLALLFKDDANPARRLVALRHLLETQGGRFRDLVLEDVRRRRDRGLARELGTAAASSLPPRAALDVLDRLLPLAEEGLMGAFMLLGRRDPQLLQRVYRTRLADGVASGLRAELVTALGFRGDAQGLDLARLAFEHDPDPGVRVRALFAVTAHAPARLIEQTLASALDDMALSGDPARLGRIAVALENVEDAGVLARVGRRLLRRRELLAEDRRRLQRLLERRLPR